MVGLLPPIEEQCVAASDHVVGDFLGFDQHNPAKVFG